MIKYIISGAAILILMPLAVWSQYSVSPSSHDFETQQIGIASENQEFVITNDGMESVVLSPEDIFIGPPEEQSVSLSFLSLNIWFDSQDWPARFQLMLNEIRELNPDFIGLQEVIERQDLDNQARQLADSLGYYYYFDSVDDEGRDTRFGNAIVSRYPIEETNFRALEPLDAYRKVVHTRISVDGQALDMYNTHLHNPFEATEIRKIQMRDMLDFIDETSTSDLVFVTGDFNANPDWEEMDVMYERFNDVYPIFYENHLDPEHGTLNYHLGHSQRRIDYVFFEEKSRDFLTPVSAEIVLDEPGENNVYPSDHFGVLANFDVSWDTGSFGLQNIPEPVELQPGEEVSVDVAFQPMTVGPKEALLQVGGVAIPLTGEGFDANVTMLPWAENFTDVNELDLPFGWSSNAENWYVFNSGHAGGAAPELVFWWEPEQEGRFHVSTPPIRTTGLDSLSVNFRHQVNNFGDPGEYTLQLVSIAGEEEFLIREWSNPESIPAEEISVRLYRGEHGVGDDQLRLSWVFDGPSSNIVRWAIDDIEVGAEPTFVVTPQEIEFGLLELGEVSDSVMITMTNIGGGTFEITPDDIRLTGEYSGQFSLNNLSETTQLASEDSTFVTVRFAPDQGGELTANLSILDINIPLTGQVFDSGSHIERYIDLNLMRGGSNDDSEFSRVPNPDPDDVNDSEEVVRFDRSMHGVPWGGFFAFLPVPLDLSEKKYIYVDVWKPRISPIRFKVEDGDSPNLEIESMVPQTKTEQWETIVFDFSEKDGEWNTIAFMPDFANPVDLDEDIVIYFSNIRLGDDSNITSSEPAADIPSDFRLVQNYPNPFNPSTKIAFEIPKNGPVLLEVFDVTGRRVATLIDKNLGAGYHEVSFDGSSLASGAYLYRMQAGDFVQTKKLMLIK